jgi:hypothetical protein
MGERIMETTLEPGTSCTGRAQLTAACAYSGLPTLARPAERAPMKVTAKHIHQVV